MMMSMRLLIYKKMIITLVIVIFAIVPSAVCDSESAGVAQEIDGTASGIDVMEADSSKTIGSMEPKQISEFFAKDDVEKFLVSLRTFLMGVRNFAEALGGFVPNNQHISEKNAMISRYSGIFNTVRVVSNAVQYITRFLEDLVIRELEDNGEKKQLSAKFRLSSMLQPFSGALKVIRSLAASALGVYNYYSPEISYSRCIGLFVQKEYPGVLPEVTLPNTFRALKATYQFAANYISMFMTQFQQVQNSVETNYADIDDNNLDNEIDQNIEEPLNPVDYRQQLYALYNKNSMQPASLQSNSEDMMRRRLGVAQRSVKVFSYGGPRQLALDEVELPTGLDESATTQNSIFNFDSTMAEHLGMQENAENNQLNDDGITFGKCTQNYALDVLWRLMERLIMNENWKS